MYEPFVLESVSDADIRKTKNDMFAITVPYAKGVHGYGRIWVSVDSLYSGSEQRLNHQHDVVLLNEYYDVGYISNDTGVRALDEKIPAKEFYDAYEKGLYRGDYSCGDWKGYTKQDVAAFIFSHKNEAYIMNYNGSVLFTKPDDNPTTLLQWEKNVDKNQSLAISKAFFTQTLGMSKEPVSLSSKPRDLPSFKPPESDEVQLEA